MINNIQEHHDEEDILKMTMESEVSKWRRKLEFVNSEIKFYVNLLESNLLKETNSNSTDSYNLLSQFIDLKKTNAFHLDT